MAYRGPDGIRHWAAGSVALAHCQLATTRESVREVQPVVDDDAGLILVCDGRIDNRDELLRELPVHRGERHEDGGEASDSDLVLRSYKRWGEQCAQRLEGDFAFVVWDARRRRAFCARDAVGMRRFFYSFDRKRFVFATDVQAIFASGIVTEKLNAGVVAEFLGLDFHSLEETCWSSVLRLLPAHSLSVDAAGLSTRRYWRPDFDARLPCKSDADYVDCYRQALAESVRRASRSPFPLAFDVSGGLDSSALFALGDRLLRDGSLQAPDIVGFHLHLPGDERSDERAYAQAMAVHVGRRVHEVDAHMPALDEYAGEALRFREIPAPLNGAICRGAAARASERGCRVAINGLGGDEWLGGYPNHPDAIRAFDLRTVIEIFVDDIRDAGLARALWRGTRWGLVPALLPRLDFTPPAADLSLLAAPARKLVESRLQVRKAPVLPGNVARYHSRLLARRFEGLEALELLLATMGMEMRSPFWSRPMIETCVAIPQRLKRRGLQNKWIHRQAMSGFLPGVVLERSDKASFTGLFERYEASVRHEVSMRIMPRAAAWVAQGFGEKLANAGESLSREEAGLMWALLGIDALASERGFPDPAQIC